MRRDHVVRATGLAKRFGPVQAVTGVDLAIAAGDVYALAGLNGAGKTTTIGMLLGLIRPSGGDAALLGTPLRQCGPAVWAKTGYLIESPSAYPELTVTQNLSLAAKLRHLKGRRHVDEVIERLGLGPYARRRARDLSLGNRQRLGLAKALIHRPRLLILDEPANGLDPAGVVDIRLLLRELADAGTAILLSSHILAEVTRLATRIGIMHRGRMITELSTRDLSAQIRRRLDVSTRDLPGAAALLRAHGYQVGVGEDRLTLAGPAPVSEPEAVAALLVGGGHPPTRLAVESEDLETFFLRLVTGET